MGRSAGHLVDGRLDWLGAARVGTLRPFMDCIREESTRPSYADLYARIGHGEPERLRITANVLWSYDELDIDRDGSARARRWTAATATSGCARTGDSRRALSTPRSGSVTARSTASARAPSTARTSRPARSTTDARPSTANCSAGSPGSRARVTGSKAASNSPTRAPSTATPRTQPTRRPWRNCSASIPRSCARPRSRPNASALRCSPPSLAASRCAGVRARPAQLSARLRGHDRRELALRPSAQPALGARFRRELRAHWGRFHQTDEVHELKVEDGLTAFPEAQQSDHFIVGVDHGLRTGSRCGRMVPQVAARPASALREPARPDDRPAGDRAGPRRGRAEFGLLARRRDLRRRRRDRPDLVGGSRLVRGRGWLRWSARPAQLGPNLVGDRRYRLGAGRLAFRRGRHDPSRLADDADRGLGARGAQRGAIRDAGRARPPGGISPPPGRRQPRPHLRGHERGQYRQYLLLQALCRGRRGRGDFHAPEPATGCRSCRRSAPSGNSDD